MKTPFLDGWAIVPPRLLMFALTLAFVVGVGVPLHAQARAPEIQNRVRLDPSQPVDFRVMMVPDTVYVGQQATYEMGVFITESAQQRMRRNPEVVPAELRGVLAYDLGGPQSLPALNQNGQRTFPHVLQRALFPLAPGLIEIPASQLSYALPRSSSYFSREETAIVRADDVTLFAKPLPVNDQPSDFSGAVGILTLQARVDAPAARVGEPLVLTVRVGGRGNVKLWPRPKVSAASASFVEAGERVRIDTSGQFVRGAKEFDWIVTPEREGRLIIPVVEYPFFDPYDDAYRIASSDSVALSVAPGQIAPVDSLEAAANTLALRRVDRGALRAPVEQQSLFWALVAFAPMPAVVMHRRRTRARARGTSASHRAPHRAPQEGADPSFTESVVPSAPAHPVRVAASSLRRRFLEELAERLDTTSTQLVERRALQQRLRRRGVTRETTRDVMSLLAQLDEAAWSSMGNVSGGVPAGDPSWTERIRELTRRVVDEAMPSRATTNRSGVKRTGETRSDDQTARGRGARKGGAVWWLLVAGALGVGTALEARETAFEAAIAQYDRGEFAEASLAFFAIAEQTPRHADAWANAGTAAWAARDTVGAVTGWQRAARLEPMARDMRERVALLPVNSRDGLARVPQIPRELPALLALVCWCLAWGLIALSGTRGRHTLWKSGLFVMVLALPASVWHGLLASRLSAAHLAVAEQRERIRVLPSDDANANGDIQPGDVVALGEMHVDAAGGNRWFAVQLVDGRLGWLPERVLYSFASSGGR